MANLAHIQLNPASDVPLYRQLAGSLREMMEGGAIQSGERLPATRELAGRLGLNRTTVSAAYAVLEESGLLEGHVGRGSFVAKRDHVVGSGKPGRTLDWDSILPPLARSPGAAQAVEISFANSRPSEEAFPLAEFRSLAKEVIDGPEAAEILQLGSPYGYGPLRRYLLSEALAAGIALPGDDLMITNGCQQALDLLARLFITAGEAVVAEDPVYHGLLRVFSRAKANLIPVAVENGGIDPGLLARAVEEHRPRLIILTPSFQNPTGSTLNLERRKRILEIAQRCGALVVENDIYSDLRYRGQNLPTLKELDENGQTILLRSYSKVSFPGLRVGWIIGPRMVIARLVEIKQICDLHSDQLSQAVLLRFAESGELQRHLERTRRAGLEKLHAVLDACGRFLPRGTRFARPDGGMNLWIELPAPLMADRLLTLAEERGVSFLPGNYFSENATHERGLRISFGGLSVDQIAKGMKILGEIATEELAASTGPVSFEPAAALV